MDLIFFFITILKSIDFVYLVLIYFTKLKSMEKFQRLRGWSVIPLLGYLAVYSPTSRTPLPEGNNIEKEYTDIIPLSQEN